MKVGDHLARHEWFRLFFDHLTVHFVIKDQPVFANMNSTFWLKDRKFGYLSIATILEVKIFDIKYHSFKIIRMNPPS